jgi:hypothetical protein
MPQRFFLTVVVSLFFFSGEIFAQEKIVEKILSHNGNLLPQYRKWDYSSSSFFSNKAFSGSSVFLSSAALSKPVFMPVAKDYYKNCLGFFCKKEIQLEKSIALPLRFRLGSVEYTDYMEGKSNAALLLR